MICTNTEDPDSRTNNSRYNLQVLRKHVSTYGFFFFFPVSLSYLSPSKSEGEKAGICWMQMLRNKRSIILFWHCEIFKKKGGNSGDPHLPQ